jgi:HSP20 family protein
MLRTFDPFAEMNRLTDELARRFDSNGTRAVFRPAVDIHEGTEAIELRIDLPGVTRDQLHIHVEKNVLTISGERTFAREGDREGYHRIERAYGAFSRTFSLPDTVNTESIDAQLRDGVLTVRLPKRAEVQPRKIEVQVSN